MAGLTGEQKSLHRIESIGCIENFMYLKSSIFRMTLFEGHPKTI